MTGRAMTRRGAYFFSVTISMPNVMVRQHSGSAAAVCHRRRAASSPLSSFCNSSTARLPWGKPRTSARNSSERIEFTVVASFGCRHVGGDVRAVRDASADGFQPGEGGGFDGGFGERGHARHASSGSGRTAPGFSRSICQQIGFSRMYCRMRFSDDSLRMMCS